MTRKETSKEFLRLCATRKVRGAYERFAAANFRHHNPYFRGDADSLRKGMEEAAAKFPSTPSRPSTCLRKATASRPDIAVVHIFRFEGERIAELWDVGMQAPQESPNQHGLF